MWGAPKSKEGKSETSGCSGRAEVCKAAMHLLPLPPSPPPAPSTSSSGPLLGETHKAFLPKREDLF